MKVNCDHETTLKASIIPLIQLIGGITGCAGHERTSKARIIHQIQLIRGITGPGLRAS
ncbi:hypothetical protein Asd1617_02983 [Shigella dysenteriae 1617]|uniref:Uncharacterized protein n=1 Tax=Shigella dysenteriae 1617 TaxID=754093 RepID=A0A0A6ZV79_SHIDY|nr:hypothetical protein Asd1617_02983 [Shigella dysenteriae 1617]